MAMDRPTVTSPCQFGRSDQGAVLRQGNASMLARILLILSLLLAPWQQGWALEPSASLADSRPPVTPDLLKSKIAQVDKIDDLDEAVKNQLRQYYRQGLKNLETDTTQVAQASKYVQAIETAPTEIKKIRQGLIRAADPPQERAEVPLDAVELKELEQQLLLARAANIALEAEGAVLTRQLTAQSDRPLKAGQRLAEIKESEDELVTALRLLPPANENAQLTEARRWMQQTRLQALHSETAMLNQELVSLPILADLAKTQRKGVLVRLEEARAEMARLEAGVNRKRQEEAALSRVQTQEAMRLVAGSPPLLQQAAATNTQLGDELQRVTTALEQLSSEKEALDKEVKKVEESYRNSKQKIELAGLGQAIGLLLYEQRRTLPDQRLLRTRLAKNEATIAATGLSQMQHREERKQLDDLEGFGAQLATALTPEEREKIAIELQTLLASRRDLLDKIITANQTRLGLLAEIEVFHRHLLKAVVAFDSFLAERLLWLRSYPRMRLKDCSDLPQEMAILAAPGPWLATGRLLTDRVLPGPIFLLAGLLALLLCVARRRIQAGLETAVQLAGNPATYDFVLPLQALGLTLLLALPGPLVMMTLGWQLNALEEATPFAQAVAIGLMVWSTRLFLLRALRILMLPKGLAAGFFHWHKATLALLRREAGWLILIFLPAIFYTQLAFFANAHTSGTHILARLTFILTLGMLGFSFYRVLHPRTGVWQRSLEEHAGRLLVRLYPFFFALLMLLPLAMSGLVLAGYVFAVGALVHCLISSIWVALALVICHQLIERWLIQSGRRLALQNAMGRQGQTSRDAERRIGDKESSPMADPGEDLIELSAESRKLLNTVTTIGFGVGLWLVWDEVMPALRIFNEFTLWDSQAQVNGQATVVAVTLADAGLAVLIGVITLTASRHFPSLLKIVLLQHLEITAGGRYTATTLSRYLIGGAGLLSIASILGFSWSQIQWLVAALGVGIGFGLQEIVANFISGLIILFERPIRVGDVVTIGTTDGVVTRIRIRATTIRDFDRKELLVPNKEFISGRLLNWSLSDPVIRVLLPVGVAYGSDVVRAMALMKEAATETPLILADPTPTVTFDSFGDNSLLLTLRCFIGSVGDRVAVRTMLHLAIEAKFRQDGIAMAFPQRDVHLDSNRPLDIRLVTDTSVPGDSSAPTPATSLRGAENASGPSRPESQDHHDDKQNTP